MAASRGARPPKFATLRVEGNRLYLSNEWGGVVMLDVSDPTQPQVLTEYWTQMPARYMFGIDRFLTTFTVAGFPYPASSAQQDQVIQLCP